MFFTCSPLAARYDWITWIPKNPVSLTLFRPALPSLLGRERRERSVCAERNCGEATHLLGCDWLLLVRVSAASSAFSSCPICASDTSQQAGPCMRLLMQYLAQSKSPASCCRS